MEVRAGACVSLWCRSHFSAFAGRGNSWEVQAATRGVFFEEASCQTRFFETKVRFLMAGPPRGDIFLSGQATTLGQPEL